MKNHPIRIRDLWKARTRVLWQAVCMGSCFLPVLGSATAAEFHVAVNGSDTSGNGSLAAPWRTPQYGASHISSGDTLFIHAGTYPVTGNKTGFFPPIAPPANTTIRSYPGDDVLIDGGATRPTGSVIGTQGRDNVTIDGLRIRGVVAMMQTKGSKLLNCDISVGGDGYVGNWDFGQLVEIEGTDACVIRNNSFHDNPVGPGNPLNSPAIQEYDSTGLLVENNEFYNTGGPGLRLKDHPDNVTVRFNYFHDTGLSGIDVANQDLGKDVFIYQNIFKNCNKSNSSEDGGIRLSVEVNNIQIFNNTFVSNRNASIIFINNVTWSAWNNISYSPSSINQCHIDIEPGAALANFTYSNYNYFYGTGQFRNRSSFYSTVSAWSSSFTIPANHDSLSQAKDPQFVNAAAGNYRRLSYPADGRGGAYSSVVGAYITGNETIGRLIAPVSSLPEINVTGNSVGITDGDSRPSVLDGTDFESLNPAGQSLTKTYTVQNVGAVALTVNPVTVSGTNAPDFTVVTQPAASVAAGASTTFTVKFDPSALGTRSAVVSFGSNDTDESPYNFSVQGRGDLVVDNADASGMTWTGSWVLSTFNPASNYFLANYRHDDNTLKGSKSARFTPTLPAAGSYEVFLRWPAAANRATNVPVDIVTAGGTVAAGPVNQTLKGGVWNSLGVYSFNAGTGGSVLLKNAGTTDFVVADAVRFSPAEVIVDNMDGTPAVVKTGTWVTSTYLPASIYGSNCWHDDNSGQGSKSVRFTPDLPTAGNYEVYTRWTAESNRASDVPVDVVTAGGTVVERHVDQRSNGGVWNTLGIHPFDAGTSGSVLIRNTSANNYVIADAVRFVKRP